MCFDDKDYCKVAPTDNQQTKMENKCKKRAKDETFFLIPSSSVWSKCRKSRVERRCIRFADDNSTMTSSSSQPLYTTYHVENFMNLVDKEELWVQPHERFKTVRIIRDHCTLFQGQQAQCDRESFQAYSDALQASFLRCCNDAQNGHEHDCYYGNVVHIELCHEDTYISNNNSSFNFHLLGLQRGLEAYCVPNLAETRLAVRKNLIQTIVALDLLLRHHPNRDDLVGSISSPLTIPSKRFAQMMGIVDEMNAAFDCDTVTTLTTDTLTTRSLLSFNAFAA